jgi:hypothetical protein
MIISVVRLFNVIQRSQAANSADMEKAKTNRGAGKASLPAPRVNDVHGKTKGKASSLAKGREGKQAL